MKKLLHETAETEALSTFFEQLAERAQSSDITIIVLSSKQTPVAKKTLDTTMPVLSLPMEGKYSKVREYIKERSRFDAEFKTFVKDRSLRDLCTRLTKEFGWYVDEHSLGSNLNRHRKD